jgi:hypothetical protein
VLEELDEPSICGHYGEDSIGMGPPSLDEIDEEAPPPNSVSVENAMGSLLGVIGLHSPPEPADMVGDSSDDYDVSLPPGGLPSTLSSPTEKAYSAMRRVGSLGHRAVDAVDANMKRGLHAVSGGKRGSRAHLQQQLSDVAEDEAEDARCSD